MNVPKELPILWYENEKGEEFIPDISGNMPPEIPEGFKFQLSRFPHVLRTSMLRINPDGTSKEVLTMESTWPEDLVLAMVNSGEKLGHSITVASESCERCLNALSHKYGLSDGYPEGSPQWEEAGTRCMFCKDPAEEVDETLSLPTQEAVAVLLGEKRAPVAIKGRVKTSNLPVVMLGLIAGWLYSRSKDKARYDRWGFKVDKHYHSRFIQHPAELA